MAQMTDLERLFHQLVLNLRATDPARLRHPLELADICNGILPYRANRRAMQLETSEDYEVALMRLCAGEAGLARTDPYEVQLEFASELESANPDLGLIQRQQKALLYLDQDAVARVSDSNQHSAFAPRDPAAERERSSKKTPPPPERAETVAVRCSRCERALPSERVVNFCPQCGHDLRRRRCPQCNTELESTGSIASAAATP